VNFEKKKGGKRGGKCRAAAAFMVSCFAVLFACESIQRATGAPTDTEKAQMAALLETSKKQSAEARAALLATAPELTRVEVERAETQERYRALMDTLTRLQTSYMTSTPEQAPGIEAAVRSTNETIKAVEARLDALTVQLSQLRAVHAAATVQGEEAEAGMGDVAAVASSWPEREAKAKAAIVKIATDLGVTIGQLFPAAGPIGEDAREKLGDLIGGLVVGGGSVATVATPIGLIALRRYRELQEKNKKAVAQAEGALNVIAVTEKVGIDEIASDAEKRKWAKWLVDLIPGAAEAFALGKLKAAGIALPAEITTAPHTPEPAKA